MNRDCIDCGTCEYTLMVGAIEGGSGPGRILYACLPHARLYAEHHQAPQWLQDAVAKHEAELAERVGPA